MKRIYKGSDLEFNLTVNKLPINLAQVAAIEFNFYTKNHNNKITKTKKDITDHNSIILEWNELSNLEQGVLYYDYKYSINNPELIDRKFDEVINTMTDYFIVTGKDELELDIPQIDWGRIKGDIIDQSDLVSYIDVQIKGLNIENYYTKQEIEDKKYLTTHQDISKKVDKEKGKSLIESTEIERLKTLKNYDDTTIKGDLKTEIDRSKKAESDLSTDVSTLQKNKVDKENGKSLIEDTEIQRLKTLKNYDDSVITTSINNLGTTFMNNINQINRDKVDKEDGKSLIDNTEIDRLKSLTNYDDTDVKNDLQKLKDDKQEKLVNGTNIKSINGNDVLGSGNLSISQVYIGDEAPTDPSVIIWLDTSEHLYDDQGRLQYRVKIRNICTTQ